jgi:hypothetical protein
VWKFYNTSNSTILILFSGMQYCTLLQVICQRAGYTCSSTTVHSPAYLSSPGHTARLRRSCTCHIRELPSWIHCKQHLRLWKKQRCQSSFSLYTNTCCCPKRVLSSHAHPTHLCGGGSQASLQAYPVPNMVGLPLLGQALASTPLSPMGVRESKQPTISCKSSLASQPGNGCQ